MGRRIVVVVAIWLASTPVARADPTWTWGAVPIANYDADAGFGLGALATVTWLDPVVVPHRASLLFQVFATSERVQGHEMRWDVVGVLDPRLRLFGKVVLYSTVNRNYCGLGNRVTCAPVDAEIAADDAGLVAGTPEHTDFVRHYHHVRMMVPSLQVAARWKLGGAASAFAQWRIAYYRSGTFSERGPYPGSLYDVDRPGGETGVASAPQIGVMHDTRDREGTPSSGHWLEASLHGATGAVGSAWSYAGFNATTRVYRRIASRVVSATRAVIDVQLGDPPLGELALVHAADNYVAFGGASAGRGIRESRYLGAFRSFVQSELRVDASRRWTMLGFVDAAWIAARIDDLGGDPLRVLAGLGAGARFVHSQTFILRADIAASPHEGWAPQVYLYLGHVF